MAHLARDLARDLTSARASALALDRALALAGDRAREGDRELAGALDRALALALDLTSARVSDLDRASDLTSSLVAQLEDCCVRAHMIERRLEEPRDVAGGGVAEGRVPWAVAIRITEWLTRVLPAPDRATYREVYRSELFELAQSARPLRVQLGYTLHCLAGVLSLRRALRMPSPQPRQQRW